MPTIPFDKESARKIAAWPQGHKLWSSDEVIVVMTSSGRIVAKYLGKQYHAVDEAGEWVIYSVIPTLNLKWEDVNVG